MTKDYKPRLVCGELYLGGQEGVSLPRAGFNAPPAELSILRKWDANLLREAGARNAYRLFIFHSQIPFKYIFTTDTAFGFVEGAFHRSELKIRFWLNLEHKLI